MDKEKLIFLRLKEVISNRLSKQALEINMKVEISDYHFDNLCAAISRTILYEKDKINNILHK